MGEFDKIVIIIISFTIQIYNVMDFQDLNPQQKTAIEFNGKHALVLAGAGTGKTKTIVTRAAYLISQGVNPQKIQILSFTRKSAGEIVQRVKAMFSSSEAKQLNGSTFHAWCTVIIKSNPKVFSFSSFTLLDPEDQIDAFKLILGKNKIVLEETRLKAGDFRDVYSYTVNTQCNLTETIRKFFYGNKRDKETNQSITEHKPFFETVIRKYYEYKQTHNQLDYDDILSSVVDVLSKNEKARRYIASHYEHILVDEMQDTNPLQWALLSLFLPYCHLFCVGDDAQSIYAFRGADFRNVHSFKERVPDSEILKLEENYRSTQEILDASNWLLEQSPLEYNKKLKAARGTGDKPIIMHFESDWEEANWISEDIINNIITESKHYSDHLILSRTAYGMRILEAVFIEKKIPYQIFGGTLLLKSAHIRDLLSALKIISNPHDELAWMRYLRLWEGIGEVTATKYIEKILSCSTIEECLDVLRKQKIKAPELIKTLEAIRPLNNNPAKAIQTALEHLHVRLAVLYASDWKSKRLPDFKILIKIAEQHSSINEFITEFILDPSLQESYLDADENKNVVTLSTIHSAKGLEADICYVLNVSPEVYPLKIAIYEGEDAVEEERRCLYVALTRAKDKLVVTRKLDSIQTYESLSDEMREALQLQELDLPEMYFFNELPDDLFEDLTSIKPVIEKKTSYDGKANKWEPFFNFE